MQKEVKKRKKETETSNYDTNTATFTPSKRIMRLALIIIGCMIFVIVWLNRASLAPERICESIKSNIFGVSKGNGYPTDIVGTKVMNHNIDFIDNNLVVVSDTSFVVLNNSAKELMNCQHSFKNPILKTSHSKYLVYDVDSKGFQINGQTKKIYDGECKENIVCGSIASNGMYGMVTRAKGYCGLMTIYSHDNKEEYKYYFSQCFVTDMCFNESGNTVAVSGVLSQSGVLNSVVYIFDFKSEKPKLMFTYEDNLITSVNFLPNGNVLAIGDNLSSCINIYKKDKKDFDYEKKNLTGFDINQDGEFILSLSIASDGRNCEIVSFDKNGKVHNTINTTHKAKAISYFGNTIAILDESNIYKYSESGKEKESCDAGIDAKSIRLNSSNSAYVLGITEIKKVGLR